jgi:uncharacterized DUF497 family protein
MQITYDPNKNLRNLAARGISFDEAVNFIWASAIMLEDTRHDYGERRFQALGYIQQRLYVLVFTPRGSAIHIISLRKANAREVKQYESQA